MRIEGDTNNETRKDNKLEIYPRGDVLKQESVTIFFNLYKY